jgi:hypothetical protein
VDSGRESGDLSVGSEPAAEDIRVPEDGDPIVDRRSFGRHEIRKKKHDLSVVVTECYDPTKCQTSDPFDIL